ncbi:MAG: hypothetical protein Q9M37_08245 [Desulfonauticus sp.]|nr:hypothetical protein [Desulfonauticus sp.]
MVLSFLWTFFVQYNPVFIKIGIFFELFWLDLLPVGTFIPPNSLVATLLCLELVTLFKVSNITHIVAIIVLSNIFSYIWSWIEIKSRQNNNLVFNNVLKRLKFNLSVDMSKIIFVSLLKMFIINFTIFYFVSFIIKFSYIYLFPFISEKRFFDWNLLFLLATIGAILSLRLDKLYKALFLGLMGLSVFYLFT